MSRKKTRVLLTGASGSMGGQTFKRLWEERERYEIVLLLRPSDKNRRLFRAYEGRGVRIVWGDLVEREDVREACRGISACLHTAALISPAADRDPESAWKVNYEGTKNLVEAIEEGDPGNCRFVYIGSVAQYGDRNPPVHLGRTGDPMIPSEFDHYALSKISAELTVMQSRIRYRVSLRQTFIMIPELFSLQDPIMFHQPLVSQMENITARDSGRLLAACLEVPLESDFWGDYYNIGGGPSCRTTYYEFLSRIYGLLGLRPEKVMERSWFALRNFHMQYFRDSGKLDHYLGHWKGGQSQEDYYRQVWKALPWYLKATAWHCRHIPPYRFLVEAVTRARLRKLARMEHGPLYWKREGLETLIRAFYGSPEAMEAIPGWGDDLPPRDMEPAREIRHGYDESGKDPGRREWKEAAAFRGGTLLEDETLPEGESLAEDGRTGSGATGSGAIGSGATGSGDRTGMELHAMAGWRCCMGHEFQMTPHAVLRGGHWCPECLVAPGIREGLAARNPFAAQVLAPEWMKYR